MRREIQRAGFHVSPIAILTPTTWADFSWHPRASVGGEKSYPLHSGTQRRGGTGKEMRNSSWRTEMEARTPAKRRHGRKMVRLFHCWWASSAKICSKARPGAFGQQLSCLLQPEAGRPIRLPDTPPKPKARQSVFNRGRGLWFYASSLLVHWKILSSFSFKIAPLETEENSVGSWLCFSVGNNSGSAGSRDGSSSSCCSSNTDT